MVGKTLFEKIQGFKTPKLGRRSIYVNGDIAYVRINGNDNAFDDLNNQDYEKHWNIRINDMFDVFYDSEKMVMEILTKKELSQQLKAIKVTIDNIGTSYETSISKRTFHYANYKLVEPILSLLNEKDVIKLYYPIFDNSGILVIEQGNIKFICSRNVFR